LNLRREGEVSGKGKSVNALNLFTGEKTTTSFVEEERGNQRKGERKIRRKKTFQKGRERI